MAGEVVDTLPVLVKVKMLNLPPLTHLTPSKKDRMAWGREERVTFLCKV